MSETTWQVTIDENPSYGTLALGNFYVVVERTSKALDGENGRTARIVAGGLSRDEAYTVANARETLSALENLWDGIHREDGEDFDSEKIAVELKGAFDVLMKAKGVKS